MCVSFDKDVDYVCVCPLTKMLSIYVCVLCVLCRSGSSFPKAGMQGTDLLTDDAAKTLLVIYLSVIPLQLLQSPSSPFLGRVTMTPFLQ